MAPKNRFNKTPDVNFNYSRELISQKIQIVGTIYLKVKHMTVAIHVLIVIMVLVIMWEH